MDSLLQHDRQIILRSLISGAEIPLPAERQIEVIAAILQGSEQAEAPKVKEAYAMLRRHLEKLQSQGAEGDLMAEGPALRLVDPRSLQDDHLNDGIFSDLADRDLDEFAENIKDLGLLQPPIITPDKRIVAGRQRIRAAIKAGLKEIPVLVRDAPSREERLKVCVSENLYRRNSSPKEIFRAYRTLYGLNQTWTIDAENLIPQLKEVVTDPDIQTFLSPLPKEMQEKLYRFLGEKIELVSAAAARKDTLETASLRENLGKAGEKVERLEDLIAGLKDEMRALGEEKDRASSGSSEAKRKNAKQISDLQWQLQNLQDTLRRLEGDKRSLVTANAELKAKYERIALGKIEREARVVEKEVMPQDYEELKQEISKVRARDRYLETFWANRRALLGAMAENERVIEGMQGHHDAVKDEIAELIEACRKMAERLESLIKRVQI